MSFFTVECSVYDLPGTGYHPQLDKFIKSACSYFLKKCLIQPLVQGQELVLHFHSLLLRLTDNFAFSVGNSTTAWNPENCPGSLCTSGSKYTSMVMALERELLAIRYSHTMYRPTDFSHLYLIIVVTASLSMNFGRHFIYREFFSHLIEFISLLLTPALEILCGSTVLSL